MSRIDRKFAELKAQGKSAFVSYIMAGDPDFDTSLAVMKGLPAAGVDIIELGAPFTDPMADGPAIQLAGQRALAGGFEPAEAIAAMRFAMRALPADDPFWSGPNEPWTQKRIWSGENLAPDHALKD